MFFTRFVLPVIALVSVLCVLAACGGGSAGSFDSALDTPDNSFVGITDGDFKAVRFNEAGYRDAALNSTLGVTTRRIGDFTEVTVAVNDTDNMIGVTMEVEYDANRFNPVGAEFHGLVNDPIEAYAPTVAGVVGLGQVTKENTMRSGDFVTVRFADGPATTVRRSSSVHEGLLNSQYDASFLDPANFAEGFVVVGDGTDYTATAYSLFAQGDGDDNGETNIADISPFILQGNFTVSVSDTEFGPAATDYDRNGEVNLTDITMIVLEYQNRVDHIDFMIADSADMTDATIHEAMAFADGASTSRTPGPFTSTDWTEVWRGWSSTVTAADITAADTNGDNEVFVSARTSDGTDDGMMFDGTSVTVTPPSDLVVTGFDVTVDTVAVVDGSTLDLLANGTYDFEVVGVSGTYNEVAFVAGDAVGEDWEGEYDAALLAVQGATTWTATNRATVANFHTTGNCMTFNMAGGSVIGTAFPDWDAESTAPDTEGSLVIASDMMTISVDLDFDVDLTAPRLDPADLSSSLTMDGDGNWFLNTVGETIISGTVMWGTTLPGADAEVMVELYNFDFPEDSITLAYTDIEPPAADKFTLDGDLLIATIAPVAPGSLYGLRVSNGDVADTGVYSSVNDPGFWFSTTEIGFSVVFKTAPLANQIGTGDGFLQVMYPEPQLRRNSTVLWNDIAGTFGGLYDEAYNDFIKVQPDNGEFPIAYTGVATDKAPRLVLVNGVVDDIGPGTATEGGSIFERNPNKIVLDIADLTTGGGMGDPTVDYAFKLYDKYDNEVGEGEFSVSPIGIDPASPIGIRWGINVFDGISRGDLDYATSDWSGHVLDADKLDNNVPDVMFVEFNGGTVANYPAALGNDNVEIIFNDAGNTMNIPVNIRAAGLDALGLNFIATHEFVAEDFVSITGTGILNPGVVFVIELDDLAVAGSPDFSFPGPEAMTIIGTNPN